MSINLTLIGQMLTFLVFIWFTMRYVWPPITKAMHDRQVHIAEGLSAAERAKRELELAQHKSVELLRDAKLEASQIVEMANRRSAQIVDEAKEQARVEGHQILENAQREVHQLLMHARESLRKEVTELAIDAAEKVLEKEIDEQSHEKLLNQLVAEL